MSDILGRIGRQHRLCAQCSVEPVRQFGETCWTCKGKAISSTKEQKIKWLLDNQSVWEGFPRHPHHMAEIFSEMQDAGLYSPFTVWTHANIYALISDARKQRRENQ